MTKGRCLALSAGILVGAAAIGGWRVYGRRTLNRVATPEGIEDPAIAEAYGRVAAMPQMMLMRQLVARRALELCATGEAADIGCGPGLLAIDMARLAPDLHITGVDLAAEMLGRAQERVTVAGIDGQITFRLGNGTSLPFDDGSLDLVVSTLSLHHWADPVAVFNEIQRVLQPGGAFLIADLRRDMAPPAYVLIWFATRCVVPPVLRRVGEPLASRDAAYDPYEVAKLAQSSQLTGWRMTTGPLWLILEGRRS